MGETEYQEALKLGKKAAKEEISKSFYAEGDDENAVTLPVNMQTSYQNGMVKAEWTLDSYRLVFCA